MDKDKVPPIIGAVLLVVGIIVVFFVFIQAMAMVTNVGDYFREQFPEEEQEEVQGPTSAFSWNTNDLNVDFRDESETGDADIRHWEWNFGDGQTSNQREPSHTYDFDGEFRVSLRVEDQNGKIDTAYGDLRTEMGNFDSGRSEDRNDMSFEFGMGGVLAPIGAAILVSVLFIVMFLVGAAMIKAGWNLVKPGPSTLKLKIKPKKLEVDQAYEEPDYSPTPTHSPKSEYSKPEPEYHSQATPNAVIASMQSLPVIQNPEQTSYVRGSPGYHQQHSYASHEPQRPGPENPIPPPPSFDSQPPHKIQDNTPHPDQTSLGAYQSNPKVKEQTQSTPKPEAPEPTRSTSKSEVSFKKVGAKRAQTRSNASYQGSSRQKYKSQAGTKQPQKPTSSQSKRDSKTRPKQRAKKSQQNNKKVQNREKQNTKSKKRKGKKLK